MAAQQPSGALGAWRSDAPVVVAVPDATRPVDVALALEALEDHLPSMRVVVGLGLHRRMTRAELAPLARWSPVQHDPDDVAVLGEIEGLPGAVSRLVAEAPWTLSVGVCELHQYAGVSGGHKGVAVGCGGRQTIGALHHRDRVLADGVRIGLVEGNPFRRAIDAVGRAARCRLALNYLPATGDWLFGRPEDVVDLGLARLDPWAPVAERAQGAVLRVPRAKALSLYQASRAATYLALSPSPPLVEGATLVLEAACPEGLGAEAGFVAAMQASRPPWREALTGPPPTGAGAQRIVMFALLARRYRLVVAGCERPEALTAVGIEATSEAPRVPAGWLDVTEPFKRLPQLVQGRV